MPIACSTSIKCNSPLEAALAEVARLGFSNVDVLTIGTWAHVNVANFTSDPEGTIAAVGKLAQQHGLRPVALNTGTTVQLHDRSPQANETRRREVDLFIRLMNHFGIKVAAIQPLQRSKEMSQNAMLTAAAQTVREQVAQARAAAVEFALELHVGSAFESMDEARQLLEIYPDVPLVYDPTHFVMQGVDIKDTAWLMKNAIHAHVRDAAKGKLQAPMGQGSVDFDWVLGSLRDHGFSGTLSIEYLESKDFDVADSVKRLHEKMRQFFAD